MGWDLYDDDDKFEGFMKVLELFVGVGGIIYGLCGYVKLVVFVEYEKDVVEFLVVCGKLVYGDVKEFDVIEYCGNIDIVIVGWLCIGFSIGGKGGGFDYEVSGLFVEVVCVVCECDLCYVFLENSYVLS